MVCGSRTLEKPEPYRRASPLFDQGPYRFWLVYSPMRRGRNRDAMALKDGMDAARIPTLVSMTDQYMAPLIT